MNYLKTSPQGIDKVIQEAQVLLYDELSTLWGVTLEGYGRVYKKEKSGKIIPEVYIGKKEYSGTLLTTDKSKFFFSKSSSSEHRGLGFGYLTDVNIYFILDLSKVKPTVTHRADQEAQIDVVDILEMTGLVVTSIIDTEIDDVLREFKGSSENFKDTQPYHVFKLECELVYDLNLN